MGSNLVHYNLVSLDFLGILASKSDSQILETSGTSSSSGLLSLGRCYIRLLSGGILCFSIDTLVPCI